MTDSNTFLYIALYDLTSGSGHKQVLLFNKNDMFVPVPNCAINPNWAVCVDMKGNVGYVPYTYVEKKEIGLHEFIWFVDDALQKFHVDSPTIPKLTREAIKNLTAWRAKLLNNEDTQNNSKKEESSVEHINVSSPLKSPKVEISEPNLTATDENDCSAINQDEEIFDESQIQTEEKATIFSTVETVQSSVQTDSINDFNVPNWLIPSLIEKVRHKTKVSHENSKAAVGVMLDSFREAIPQLDIIWNQLKRDLRQSEVTEEKGRDTVYSEDQRKLLDIFQQLWYCKNDEQQRSWPVHEDEDSISGLLVDMNNILLDANPRVTRSMVQCDEYEMVNLLATYYQMEPRRTLRLKMLNVFITLCELDVGVITQLLNSVLPIELARDIQDNFEDNEKVLQSSFLLSVIFCTGETPPLATYDFINKKFLHFLFDKLEEVIKEGDEDLGQNLLSIILAFNLHFKSVQENIVLETLKGVNSAQVLTEKLVLLLNREEDPCQILILSEEATNSVMKFMVDLFSSSDLIELFYLNDIKVLLDIIVRQLTDMLPGEKKRLNYLCLVRNLLKNSNYFEHMHQFESMKKCFKILLGQEFPDKEEVALVLDIKDKFPSHFQDVA